MTENVVVIEKVGERISAAEEVSEYVLGMLECKMTVEAVATTAEVRAPGRGATAGSAEALLAVSIVNFSLVLVRQRFVRLSDLFEYFLSLLAFLLTLALMFVL